MVSDPAVPRMVAVGTGGAKAGSLIPRLTLVAALAVFSGPTAASAPPSSPSTTQAAADRVSDLRVQVTRSQIAYGGALSAAVKPAADVVAHLQILRIALKRALLEGLRDATGSESVLAANRALLVSTLEAIHTYETSLGVPVGRLTTAWNVLETHEIAALRTQAVETLASVQKMFDALPVSERPPALLTRQREIVSWITALEHEQAQRNAGINPAPPEIQRNVTIEEARLRFPTIRAAERQMRSSFERQLAYQVELRLAHSPSDASLLSLRDQLPKAAVPILRAAPKRGPPSDVAALRIDTDRALQSELLATTARDPVRRAQARAVIKINLETLAASGTRRHMPPGWGADLLTTSRLQELRKGYVDWLSRLRLEATADSGGGGAEARDAANRVAEIDAELDRRTFGWKRGDPSLPEDPRPNNLLGRPPPSAKSPPILRARQLSRTRDQLSAELLFLQREADAPHGITEDLGLKRELTRTATALKREDARLAEAVRDTISRIEANLLSTGRGQEAAAEGARLLRAKQMAQARPAEAMALVETSQYLRPRPRASAFGILTEADQTVFDLRRTPRTLEVPLRTAGTSSASPGIADFGTLFPHTAQSKDRWTRSHRGVMQDLHRAPGGVVIDARLPPLWSKRVQQATIDPQTGAFKIQVDGEWKDVRGNGDTETLRLAYAFVRDGRVMPIDLRNLTLSDSLWLAERLSPKSGPVLAPSDWRRMAAALASLTVVNIHPALRDTTLALQMISADQLIFALLPDQLRPEPLAGSLDRFGLNVAPLRARYLEDFHNLSDPASWQALLQKSILSVTDTTAHMESNTVRVKVTFGFAVYRLPASKAKGRPILLAGSTRWLQQNEEQLEQVPVLKSLATFAEATAVMRTILEQNLPNNFDELLSTPVREIATPRLLCRPDGPRGCPVETLRASLTPTH